MARELICKESLLGDYCHYTCYQIRRQLHFDAFVLFNQKNPIMRGGYYGNIVNILSRDELILYAFPNRIFVIDRGIRQQGSGRKTEHSHGKGSSDMFRMTLFTQNRSPLVTSRTVPRDISDKQNRPP